MPVIVGGEKFNPVPTNVVNPGLLYHKSPELEFNGVVLSPTQYHEFGV